MPRQDDHLIGGQAAGGPGQRRQDNSQGREPTEAPEAEPSGLGRSGSDDNPAADDPATVQIRNDPLDESPAEDDSDDPDSTSDTVLTPESPSEYDRQRDALPNRDVDNWATAMASR